MRARKNRAIQRWSPTVLWLAFFGSGKFRQNCGVNKHCTSEPLGQNGSHHHHGTGLQDNISLHHEDHHKDDLLSIPKQGPTWYSHCAGITSALVPEILTPASVVVVVSQIVFCRRLKLGATYTSKPCSEPQQYHAEQPFQCRHRSSTLLGCAEISILSAQRW